NTSIHSASNETPFKLHKGTTGIRSILYTFKNEDVVFSEDDPTASHRLNYIERLKRTSNYNPNDICVGSLVLLRYDFDANPATRRRQLDYFYDDDPYEVVEINARQLVLKRNDLIKHVDISQVKKVQ
ncbi:hypothetical protein ENBRE01_1840, partial [Enteropsectra breve]